MTCCGHGDASREGVFGIIGEVKGTGCLFVRDDVRHMV